MVTRRGRGRDCAPAALDRALLGGPSTSPLDSAGAAAASRVVRLGFCSYNNQCASWDPAKRVKTLAERGLDFADAATVFAGVTVEVEDTRRDYGETRMICFGLLEGRMVVVGYVPRGSSRHIFSMRKANAREQERLAAYFEI